ncbi:thioredoxin family protein [Amphibacillus cookii]|uniref:thioredoxin family protein n=1 Tax=Amphibacillus cookii TaxID=767787 RepID=UPI0019584355|nr:thioredoxin family protein [Amphibacillus cookii]MBM7540332.1 thiol-disulfide isomerase/thioredoxin [Amphibacillus cookii]
MTSFITLDTIKAVDQFINGERLTFLYLSKSNCSVCISLLPQIENVLQRYPMIKSAYINIEQMPQLASRFQIFTVPVLLLFIDGKEYLRKARIVGVDAFNDKIKRIVKHFPQ